MSSESVAPQAADAPCPFCLSFPNYASERAQGGRFCPLCGADWSSLDRTVQPSRPIENINPFEGMPLPLQAPPPSLQPESTAPPQVMPPRVTPVPLDVPVADPLESALPLPPQAVPPRTSASALGPATMGLTIGLAVTLSVAFLVDRSQRTSQPAAPVAAPAKAPVKAGHAAPHDAAAAAPVIVAADAEVVELPSPRKAPGRLVEAVDQAIALAAKDLPAASRVEVSSRVEDGIAFLKGQVDSADTMQLISKAATGVFGIRAVDTSDIEVAYRRHTVAAGDTLSKLAGHYYGNRLLWTHIWEANKHLAHGPTALDIGQVLLIPNAPPQ